MTCLLQQPKWTKIPAIIIWNPSRRIASQVALAFIESHFLSKIAPKLKKKKKKDKARKVDRIFHSDIKEESRPRSLCFYVRVN